MTFKLETEEELKEYIDKLGIEYKFSCFKEKDPEACHLLGDYQEAVKKDFEGAAKIFKSNCDERQHKKSCYKFATFSYLGKGCEANNHVSYDYYKKSCDLGYSNGCLNTGVMLSSPEKDPQTGEPFIKTDYVTALTYLEKACTAKVATACFLASGLYIKGAEGVPQDKVKASQLAKDACDGGNIYACMNVSQMYKRGDGVAKDETLSTQYKEKAKELRDDAKKKQSLGLQQYT
ncbi:cytochrome c oxidase assembly factor 7 homolog [Parasteatoda tepidariorum]|nr:cytochrome c oxidase assembly factor 7 homolog [Parasteatoda tepidariorum]